MNGETKKRGGFNESIWDRGKEDCISRLDLVLLSAGIWLGNLIRKAPSSVIILEKINRRLQCQSVFKIFSRPVAYLILYSFYREYIFFLC